VSKKTFESVWDALENTAGEGAGGRISKFSLDALVNMAAAVGLRVALHVEAA
jgi:predicted XRE-type DNA-binding protein